jgi:prefoldin subunit 5
MSGIQIPDNPLARKLFGHLVGLGADPNVLVETINNATEFKANVEEVRGAIVEMSRDLKELNSTMRELNTNLKGGVS